MSFQQNPPFAPTLEPQLPQEVFRDIEQDFQKLWNQELALHQQQLQSRLSVSPAPAVQRRKRKQRQSFNLPTLPQAPQLKHIRTAGSLTALAALAVWGGQQWLAQAPEEKPAIQQVMYQNAETKVAAFRKEIESGQHYLTESTRPVQYKAKDGDTIAKIAKRFHVSSNTILQNNDRKKIDDVLEPGTKLTILPVDGIAHPVERRETLSELSKRYDVDVKEILEVNALDNPHMIAEKQKIIIPNATELKRRPKPKPVLKAVESSRTGHTAPVSKSKTGRRLSWPTNGTTTSNYGWRWFRMHNGMDIAASVGTPIKAAKEGRVVFSGWMGGYGYAVDVDHGNGIKTRYAHCSALKVNVGQYVHRGQLLGLMGSTGNSTGPHLHFEVHVNGTPVDPRTQF